MRYQTALRPDEGAQSYLNALGPKSSDPAGGSARATGDSVAIVPLMEVVDAPLAPSRAAALRRGASLGALVASNLLPLFGVFHWDWDVGALLVLYWSENLVIGAFTLVKLVAHAPLGGLLGGAFFLIHYGGFCAIHGAFVLALGLQQSPRLLEGETWPAFLVFVQLLVEVVRQVLAVAPAEWLVAFAALAASHGVSLALNYFGSGEHRRQTHRSLMTAPYRRVVVLHLAILGGGVGVATLGSPLPLLVTLVALKLVVDAVLHLREHRAVSEPRSAMAAG